MTPALAVLERFASTLDSFEIRGQELPLVDKHGGSHKRGPSKWQQRRCRLWRNLAGAEAKMNVEKIQQWQQAIQSFEDIIFDFDLFDVRRALELNCPGGFSADSPHLSPLSRDYHRLAHHLPH